MSNKSSKRLRKSKSLIDKERYSLDDALIFLNNYKKECSAKFDETVELILELGIDPKHSDQIVRGAVVMPSGLGKDVRVCAIVKPERIEEAKSAGADIAGYEDVIENIKAGKLDFDVCLATPDVMPKLASVGKILGPKGLMPNPKIGTVSSDIAVAIKKVKAGQVEYKNEKAGLVHAGIGKISFVEDALRANIKAMYSSVLAAKPSVSKGVYMRKMYIGTSQGPSIPIDFNTVLD